MDVELPAPSEPSPWHVAVLSGGDSAEREISLESGTAVARALRERGHTVHAIDPSRQPVHAVDWSAFDVAFIALHGTFGEDGGIQEQLDELGVLYTGSGAEASRLAFDKTAAKNLFRQQGIRTPPEIILRAASHPFPGTFPLVVKPRRQGSSLGVTIVHDPGEFPAALAEALRFDDCVLIEQAILGEEWTVPILDRMVLPPIRISTDHQFFDFTAKYRDERTRYDVIRDFEDPVCREVTRISLAACEALHTAGICRVDLMLDAEARPSVLEVNTIPGMTDHSLVPKSATAWGWSFGELCERAIRSALAAH